MGKKSLALRHTFRDFCIDNKKVLTTVLASLTAIALAFVLLSVFLPPLGNEATNMECKVALANYINNPENNPIDFSKYNLKSTAQKITLSSIENSSSATATFDYFTNSYIYKADNGIGMYVLFYIWLLMLSLLITIPSFPFFMKFVAKLYRNTKELFSRIKDGIATSRNNYKVYRTQQEFDISLEDAQDYPDSFDQKAVYDRAYKKGYDKGYVVGRGEGFKDGKEDQYDEGYEKGYADGYNASEPLFNDNDELEYFEAEDFFNDDDELEYFEAEDFFNDDDDSQEET